MLRSLKKKRDDKIRVTISKETLQSSKDTYLSKVDSIRKNNFNTTSVIDGHTGDMNIANHFQNKFSHLYNQVKLRSRNLVTCTLLSLPWYEIKDVPIYRCKRFKFRTLGVKFRYIYCS